MTAEQAQVATVQLPFPDLERLQAVLPAFLSPRGMFIETGYPPPIGKQVELILVVGSERTEVARFRAEVISHQPWNSGLTGKKGVQLQYLSVQPNAVALFTSLGVAPETPAAPVVPKEDPTPMAPPPSEEEDVLALGEAEIISEEDLAEQTADPAESTTEMSDGELQKHLQQLNEARKEELQNAISQEQTVTLQSPQAKIRPKRNVPDEDMEPSLVDEFDDLVNRPGREQVREIELGQAARAPGVSDDFSSMGGAGGFQMSDTILGIDLGTCNSCIAVVKDGQPRVIPDERGFRTTPSVVSYMEDGKVIVGRDAMAQMAKNPRTSIYGAKRFIGRSYNSPVVQGMLRYFPYKLIPDDKNHTAIDIFGKPVSLESVSAEILKGMVSIAQSDLGESCNKVIVTVPAYYSDNQRQAVKDAGILAGLDVIRIINEPTAAALSVGFNQNMQKRILVYDLGGGTFDVSILEIKNNTFQVVATGGDTFLGGEDYDNRLVKWVLESSRDEGVTLARSPVVFERLKQACERAKCDLSEKREAMVNLPYIPLSDGKTINFQKPIDRERLMTLTRDLTERSISITEQVLNEARLTIQDIDELVMVGGMTRVPYIRAHVHQHFGKKPYGDINPDEAVAMGAAILGGELTGSKRVAFTDVLSMSIGIALPKNRFKPILQKNVAVPCNKKYRINADLTKEFTIDVFQGDSQKCDENEYLGTLVFSDEVRTEQQQALEIEFELSPECLLSCIIRNPDSGKSEKALLITHDTPPSAKLA